MKDLITKVVEPSADCLLTGRQCNELNYCIYKQSGPGRWEPVVGATMDDVTAGSGDVLTACVKIWKNNR